MSQHAHQAGAYPSFCSMKRLGVFLLPTGWDASCSPLLGYPKYYESPVPIYTPGWREVLSEHNAVSLAMTRTRTT